MPPFDTIAMLTRIIRFITVAIRYFKGAIVGGATTQGQEVTGINTNVIRGKKLKFLFIKTCAFYPCTATRDSY